MVKIDLSGAKEFTPEVSNEQKALDAIQEELSASEDLDTVKARIKELTAKSNQLRSEEGAWRENEA